MTARPGPQPPRARTDGATYMDRHRALQLLREFEGDPHPFPADAVEDHVLHPALEEGLQAVRSIRAHGVRVDVGEGTRATRHMRTSSAVLLAAYLHLAHQDRELARYLYARLGTHVGDTAADRVSEFGVYVLIACIAADRARAALADARAETPGAPGSGPATAQRSPADADGAETGETTPIVPADGPWGAVIDAVPVADGIVEITAAHERGLLVSPEKIVAMPDQLCPNGILHGGWAWIPEAQADLVRLAHADDLGLVGERFDRIELHVARMRPQAWAQWTTTTDAWRPGTVPYHVTFCARQDLRTMMMWLSPNADRAEATDRLVECGLNSRQLAGQVWLHPDSQAFAGQPATWPDSTLSKIRQWADELHRDERAGRDPSLARLALHGWKRYAHHLGVPPDTIAAAGKVTTRPVKKSTDARGIQR